MLQNDIYSLSGIDFRFNFALSNDRVSKSGFCLKMGIQKDIQQKSFRNNYQKAAVNIIFSSNWLTEKIKDFLDEGDITNQQYNILRILRGTTHPLSTLQIRERMLDKMSDTSRIVDRLVKKGLVQKVVCSYDKRLVDISITDSGRDLLAKLDLKNADIDNLINKLTDEEAHQLNFLLDKMRGHFSQTTID
jgi:DNA-binding MarR family transcriptional regulator